MMLKSLKMAVMFRFGGSLLGRPFMFEELRLLGSTEQSIVVQTRKGTNVKNVIELDPGDRELRVYDLLLRKSGGNWVRRKPPTGVYNCAGHVWASRRTSILEEDQWRLSLAEDGYRRLSEAEAPAPDDLVLYVDADSNGFLHVARILELRSGIGSDSHPLAWVLSKRDSISGEAMHFDHDVSHLHQGFRVRTEYWTDRPIEREER